MTTPALHITRSGRTSWVHGACDYCGGEVVRAVYTWRRAERHYCSDKCANLDKRRLTPPLRDTRICDQCGSSIERALPRFNETHNFCGRKCYGDWKAGRTPLDCFLSRLTAERIAELDSLRDEKRLLERLVAIYTPPPLA